MTIREAFAPLVDLVYPPRCPTCGGELAAQGGLCSTCWAELIFPDQVGCRHCQRPLRDGEEGACAACFAKPPLHNGVAAATIYTDASRKLVLAFKQGKRIALAPMLGRMIAGRLPELEGEWLVVPVPLHPVRLWYRGFNQAALLAREIARARGQKLLVDGLARRRSTRSLSRGRLSKSERARELAGAIAISRRHRQAFKGSRVILVDDVMTSGATTDACLTALRKAGAEKVLIACFARVLD